MEPTDTSSVQPTPTSSAAVLDKVFPFLVGHRTEIVAVLAGLTAALRLAYPDNPTVETLVNVADAVLLPFGLGFLAARSRRQFNSPS